MRPMDDAVIEQHLENIDRRLTRVEQILPTLSTKDELCLVVAPLATRGELRLAIAEAIAPLATKDEIRELRRHMDVLNESQREDIQLLAAHLAVAMSKLTD